MPPVHPAIVHFPIAFVTLSVLADLFGYILSSESLRGAAWWSIAGAALGAALAVVAGLFDMNREKIQPEAHERVHTHMKVGFVVFSAVSVLTLWRWAIYANLAGAVGWAYLVVAFLVLVLTLFQANLGSRLVFSDGVGVAPSGQGTQPSERAKKRKAQVAGGEGEHQH